MDVNGTFRALCAGLPDDIRRLKEHGDFQGALAAIDARLAREGTPEMLRRALTAQAEMIRRLPANYPFSRGEALARVRRHMAGFSDAEFDEMVRDGRIDWIYVDGAPRYFARFFETLCKVDGEFAARAGIVPEGKEAADVGGERRTDRAARLMRQRGSLAVRFRCKASLRIKDSAFRTGAKVCAALPLPCACLSQSDIEICRSAPAAPLITPESSSQRVALWNEVMTENREFSMEFAFTRRQTFVDLSRPPRRPMGKVPGLDDTSELPPHLLFTPFMKDLAAEIAGDADGPLEKARRFYDFITQKVHYRFMPEYFCLEDIAAGCARSLTGDCGVQALLFMALCRVSGIPARWESGWMARPDFCGSHDWIAFYALPFGWLYADPSFGGAAAREGNETRRQFYFGNVDPWRMAANTAFQADFPVPWPGWRRDPYDNQSGEVSVDGVGLRSDQLESAKEVLEAREIL
ncbi:MAG: transglutaminase-like domain-containing protein [Pyramidobacter sp.]|jgi:transglutaminase-like putative cysteine protease